MKKEYNKTGVRKRTIFFLMLFSIATAVGAIFIVQYLVFSNFLLSNSSHVIRPIIEQKTYIQESDLTTSIQKVSASVVAIVADDQLEKFKKSKIALDDRECALFTEAGYNCWTQSVSGFLVTSDGVVVTTFSDSFNKPNQKFTIILNDHTEYTGQLLMNNQSNHLAFFQLIKKGEEAFLPEKRTKLFNLPVVEFGSVNDLQVGEKLITLSFQNVQGSIISFVSDIAKLDKSYTDYFDIADSDKTFFNLKFQRDPPVLFDGGPIINLEGQIVGLTSSKNLNDYVIAEVISTEVINKALRDVRAMIDESSRFETAYLGLKYLLLDKNFARKFNLPVESGVYLISGYGEISKKVELNSIKKDSNAQKLGLKSGDIIVEMNSQIIDSRQNFLQLLSSLKVGDKITMKILRNAKAQTLEGVLF